MDPGKLEFLRRGQPESATGIEVIGNFFQVLCGGRWKILGTIARFVPPTSPSD
jgi:hypothetical protein